MPVDTSQPYDEQNVFARILRGEIPSTAVYEDEWAYAFPDIAPEEPVHVLVIPKGRYVGWDDFTARASDAEIAGLARAVGEVARREGVAESGYRLLVRVGAGGGQEIPHLHFHVLAGKRIER